MRRHPRAPHRSEVRAVRRPGTRRDDRLSVLRSVGRLRACEEPVGLWGSGHAARAGAQASGTSGAGDGGRRRTGRPRPGRGSSRGGGVLRPGGEDGPTPGLRSRRAPRSGRRPLGGMAVLVPPRACAAGRPSGRRPSRGAPDERSRAVPRPSRRASRPPRGRCLHHGGDRGGLRDGAGRGRRPGGGRPDPGPDDPPIGPWR